MAGYRKLGRTASQRKALLRNQVTNLLYHGKIQTTEAKAKEIRRIAEKLITLAVKEKDNFDEVTVTARRKMLSYFYPVVEAPVNGRKKKANTKNIDMANHMFEEVAPKYADRNGGYTRMIKIGARRGDGAEVVIIELV